MTLTEFLLARIAEDEQGAHGAARLAPAGASWQWLVDYPDGGSGGCGTNYSPHRALAECEAKRRIVEWHQNWPVMVETQPKVEPVESADPAQFAYRASQQLAWMTEREYVARFGTEPPTSPILRLLALPYADHPDYDEAWRA